MVEFLLWGVFALEVAQDNRLSGVPILEIARTPIFINLGILGALIVPLVSQGNVRNALTAVSLVCLMAMCGLIFAAGVMTFCGLVFLFARLLQAWSARRSNYKLPLLVAWLTVNAVYLPFFFLKLPQFGSFMSVGELALLWGPAFLVFKADFSQNKIGEIDTELFREFFQALAINAGITLHIENFYFDNNHHLAESMFKAVARALREAVEIDPRMADQVPSTKGVL